MLKYLFVLFSLSAFSQQKTIDSLLHVFNGKQHDTIRFSALNELAICTLPPKNDFYNNKLIKEAEAKMKSEKPNSVLWKKYLAIVIEAYYTKAVILSNRSQKDSAIFYYDKCEALDVNSENLEMVGYCQISKGGIYTNRGMYKEAIALFYKALNTFEKGKNTEGIGDTYLYMGRLYHIQQNYALAIEYLKKAYSSFKRLNNPFLMADALNKIGLTYISTKNYGEAINYFNKCIELSNKCGLDNNSAQESLNYSFAFIHYSKAQLKEAEQYLKKSIALAVKANNFDVLSNRYYLMASIYYDQKRIKEAIVYCKKAFDIESKEKDIDEQMKLALFLAKAYNASKNYQLALEYYQISSSFKDSLLKTEGRKQVMESKLNYEFEKKALISKTNHDKEIFRLNSLMEIGNAKRKSWIIILTLGILAVLAFTLFLYKHQKQKNIIEVQNSNLLRQKMLLSQMNPHFVFNSINSIQSFILDKKEKEAYSYLAKFSKLIRMVLNNTEELVIPLFQEIDLLKTYIELEQLRFEKAFEYELLIDNDLDEQGLFVPPMLIQPYVENAIWHGLMNLKDERIGKLRITFTIENNLLKIVIEDNGIGRSKAALYEKESIHRPIAMKLTEKRLQMIHKAWGQNGIKVIIHDLLDETEKAIGTRVEVFLPIDLQQNERS